MVRPALFLAALSPLGWIGLALFGDRVDGDQVKFIQHVTGRTALVSLFLLVFYRALWRLNQRAVERDLLPRAEALERTLAGLAA